MCMFGGGNLILSLRYPVSMTRDVLVPYSNFTLHSPYHLSHHGRLLERAGHTTYSHEIISKNYSSRLPKTRLRQGPLSLQFQSITLDFSTRYMTSHKYPLQLGQTLAFTMQ